MNNVFIKKITIENFKGIEHLELDLNDALNVLIGINGSGKSSILLAISTLLSKFTGRMRSIKSNGNTLSESDIRSGTSSTSMKLALSYYGQNIEWCIEKHKRQSKQSLTDLTQVNELILALNKKMLDNEALSLPVMVLYGVGRNVLDIPLKVKKHPSDQLAAYDGALLSERSTNDFRLFFEWFRNCEDIENENIREHLKDRNGNNFLQCSLFDEGQQYTNLQLSAVRKAIESLLPGFSDLHVKRRPLMMVATKKIEGRDSVSLDVGSLSDGEKCVLAMVGDLARRLAIANPSLQNPLQGDGIVLIDEIDLHLHPQWEAEILPRLLQTFPNCQFIVTTHSPVVLSGITADNIFEIHHEDTIKVSHPGMAKGLSVDEILLGSSV